ncbi:MAG: hypothetical protein NC132_05930 [Corallococcus sp.]|nr:hypothetical protein [Corallococcus sp.]MCM1360069.1 hypothetical protein [Corallococcus sp.]MCM1395626.1 hypothetical protein [Corallococcus sp.]
MLQQGIKNYFKNLKLFFTPMGAMFLGLVFGASVFFPVTVAAFKQLAEGVNELSRQFNVDFNQLFKSLFDSVGNLDWSKPWDAIQTMFSNDWLKETVAKSLEALLGVDYQTFSQQITELMSTFSTQVSAGFAVLVMFFVLGVVGGYYLTAFLVRRSIARRAWWKFLLAYLVDFVVNVALLVLGVWLAALWKYSAIVFVFVAFVLSGLVSLVSAYVMQGYKKVSFQQVVNFKNAVQYMSSALIVWVINLAVCVLVKVITNNLVATVVAIALIEIVIPVNKLNAEAYVKSMVDAATGVYGATLLSSAESDKDGSATEFSEDTPELPEQKNDTTASEQTESEVDKMTENVSELQSADVSPVAQNKSDKSKKTSEANSDKRGKA